MSNPTDLTRLDFPAWLEFVAKDITDGPVDQPEHIHQGNGLEQYPGFIGQINEVNNSKDNRGDAPLKLSSLQDVSGNPIWNFQMILIQAIFDWNFSYFAQEPPAFLSRDFSSEIHSLSE